MSENQPRQFDAVLGGNIQAPVTGVVLGGIEGVKRRLESEDEEVRIEALSDALKYQEAGLNLVIQALGKFSLQEKKSAARLLKRRGGEKGKRALLEFDPYLYFTKLDDWELSVVSVEGLQSLLSTSEANNIKALKCEMYRHYSFYKISKDFTGFVNILSNTNSRLTNLKALFIGDNKEHEYRKSRQGLSDITPVLESFPELEVLQLRGYCGALTCNFLKHNYLKTLVIETRYLLESTTEQIAKLKLPNLEYLELWFGNAMFYANNFIPEIAKNFPKLKYLGIRSCENADDVTEEIVSSPLIERLKILDFSKGTMTNKGVEYLLNCPSVNQLHTLDVSMNYISDTTALEQLACHVIAQPQDHDYGDRYLALYE